MVSFDRLLHDRLQQVAWKYQFLTYPNPPVAAALVKNGEIISLQTHKQAGTPHAEVLALKEGYKKLTKDSSIDNIQESKELHDFLKQKAKNLFNECDLHITLEPCNHFGKTPPCSLLIKELKPKRVIYATCDMGEHSGGGGDSLRSAGIESINLNLKKAQDLLEPFEIWKKRGFVLFKLALRLDGTIDGEVSNIESKKYAHKIRSVIDRLIIGGNTVREDRPILDSRLCQGNAPDVTIYSKNSDFDKNIPLFGVPNRTVSITDSLNFDTPSFLMIEGGNGTLEAFRDRVDWFLLFISTRFGGDVHINSSLELSPIHTDNIDGDLVLFARNS